MNLNLTTVFGSTVVNSQNESTLLHTLKMRAKYRSTLLDDALKGILATIDKINSLVDEDDFVIGNHTYSEYEIAPALSGLITPLRVVINSSVRPAVNLQATWTVTNDSDVLSPEAFKDAMLTLMASYGAKMDNVTFVKVVRDVVELGSTETLRHLSDGSRCHTSDGDRLPIFISKQWTAIVPPVWMLVDLSVYIDDYMLRIVNGLRTKASSN